MMRNIHLTRIEYSSLIHFGFDMKQAHQHSMKFVCKMVLIGLIFLSGQVNATSLSDWMSDISDQSALTAITIPGTHDSGSRYESVYGTAKTQTLSITEQLNDGVRYLDIRLRHYKDALVVHHGSVYQHLNFNDVLQSVTDFLILHPSETVLMEVSKEYQSAENTRTFEQTFITYKNRSDYQSYWWSHSYLPTLGQSRGKIVLLRRFAGSFWVSGGIDVTGWQDNTEFNLYDSRHVKIHVQDDYQVKASSDANKWQSIKTNLNDAAQNTDVLYLNFTSGYVSILGIPNIRKVSNTINSKLINYFLNQSKNKKTHGVIISDFITKSFIKSELQ